MAIFNSYFRTKLWAALWAATKRRAWHVDPCAMDAEVRGYSIDDLAAIFAGEFTVEEIRVWAKWME